jgi:hypothetical protein
MQYRTKVIINGAEILDEQSDTASSITNVKLTESCGQGFQIGSTASTSLSFTMLKPYKESFDGDKVELYILQANAEDETTSLKEELEEEVGDSTETLAISDDSSANAEVETEETEDPDEEGAEDMTDEEVAEAEAEWNELGASLYEFMNGEEVTDEDPGTETEEEAITWECIGAFYVYSQTNNTDGSVALQCYDGFNLMNGTYTPSQKEGTFQEFYDDLRTQCAAIGVTVDEDDFTDDYNPALTWDQVCSYRTAFGYLAGLQGGFGTFDGDDTLGISYYGYSGELFLVPDLLSYSLTSAGETEIDGVICTINLNQDTVSTGEEGQSLKFYNPFMTEEQANAILSQYRGVRYYGANIKAKWNSDLLAGDLIRVMSSEEYKNYVAMMNSMANSSSMTADEVLELKKQINAVGKSILISSQTISFTAGGETIAEITSYLPTESEKANAPLSPSNAKFRTVTADLIQTKELIADKASITDLEAVTGRVTTLESETVKTSELDAKVATIVEADIKTAEIDGAQIKDATITNAKIDSINGEKITDGSIVAAALSKEAIETLGGNTVYYQAIEPTGGTYAEGDIWYKTVTETSGDSASILYVYDGTTWVNKPFDSESILAKSITAGEIASGTITTGEINMDNLQTNIARIGDADGKHVQIDEDSVDIMDGETVLASYGDGQSIYSENGNLMSQTTATGISGYDDNGLKIYYIGQKAKEEVNGVTAYRNHRIISFRCYENSSGELKLSSSQPIATPVEWDTSKTTKLWAVKYNPSATLEAGDQYYAIPSEWVTTTDAGTDGRGVSNVTVTLTETAISKLELDKDDCIFVCASYMAQTPQDAIVLFNRTDTVTVTDYIGGLEKDELINYPVVVINETYIESFMHRGVGGFSYASLRRAHVRELRVEADGDLVKKVKGNDVSFTTVVDGTGTMTCTAGAVGVAPKYSRCGNVVQLYCTVKATGAVASGKNIATGTITGIPKPKLQTRSVSYYGDNANVTLLDTDGSFTSRNCGSDALAKGNDCGIVATYITDGTML